MDEFHTGQGESITSNAKNIKDCMKGLEGPALLAVATTTALEGSQSMKIKGDVRSGACRSHLRICRVPEEAEEPSPRMTSPRAMYW